jgi:hypothetical protein
MSYHLMYFLELCLGLLASLALLIAYFLAVRLKRGPFRDAPPCPRCKAPLPRVREPGSFRQAFFGGWTCPACGCGVDKRGREIPPIAPRTALKSEDEIWKAVKIKFVIMTPLGFCFVLITDVWRRVAFTGVPFGWNVILASASLDVFTTMFCAVGALLFLKSFIKRKKSGAPGVLPGSGLNPKT